MLNIKRPGGHSLVLVAVALAIAAASYGPAAIVQAIIPAAVPTVNKQGSTGTKFHIANGTFTNGNLVSTDANGNASDFGSGTLATINSQALPFGGSITLPAGSQTAGGLQFSNSTFVFVNSTGGHSIFPAGIGSTTTSVGYMNTAGAYLHIQAWGQFITNAAGTTMNSSLTLNGTTLGSSPLLTFPALARTYEMKLDYVISTYSTGSSGTVYASGTITFIDNSVASSPVYATLDAGGPVTVNLTGALPVGCTFVMGGTIGSWFVRTVTIGTT